MEATRPTLFIGSCFSDNIGNKMVRSMSPASVNPCGVQYNPGSIASLIETCTSGAKELSPDIFFPHENLWKCWLLPSRFAAVEKDDALQKAREAFKLLSDNLKEAQAVAITFGTAYVYEHIGSELSPFSGIVGNCHKVPAKEFTHRMLSVDEITTRWKSVIAQIRHINPEIKIIYTVSPVRHLNPSPRLNTLSKATLHLAVDELVKHDADTSYYFPAWELLMDDLRDYRFYADDMCHPSDKAIDYIWERFCETFYSESERQILAEGERKQRRLNHRPILTT